MARAHFVGKARKNIYENGKYRKYKSKKGKNKGKMLEVLDVTIPENNKDKILIKKGESYWWWQFKNSNKSYSKTQPKASQLTRSGFLSQLYDITDRMSSIDVSDAAELESVLDDIKSDIENLKDETESSLQNMPDHLQESSSSGQLLQERIDALDNAYSELDGVDCSYDEPSDEELRDEAISDLGLNEDDKKEMRENKDEIAAKIEELREDKFSEWLDEKRSEIENISIDC